MMPTVASRVSLFHLKFKYFTWRVFIGCLRSTKGQAAQELTFGPTAKRWLRIQMMRDFSCISFRIV